MGHYRFKLGLSLREQAASICSCSRDFLEIGRIINFKVYKTKGGLYGLTLSRYPGLEDHGWT